MKKLLFLFFFLISEMFAFDLSGAINELKCKSFSLSNEKMVGMYKYFDTKKNLWFLYMPNEKYLLIHQTGKNKISQGAKAINIKNFSNIDVKNGCISFGMYNGNNESAKELSDKKYCLSNEKMVGMYKYFDTKKNLWFLYMPNEKYLLIHQTGKYTIKDGAKQVKINDYFKKITIEKDPFGNSLGIIKFIPLTGCDKSVASSSIGSENNSSLNSSAGDNSSTGNAASQAENNTTEGNNSSTGNAASQAGNNTETNTNDLVYPPTPGINSNEDVQTPPSPGLNNTK